MRKFLEIFHWKIFPLNIILLKNLGKFRLKIYIRKMSGNFPLQLSENIVLEIFREMLSLKIGKNIPQKKRFSNYSTGKFLSAISKA